MSGEAAWAGPLFVVGASRSGTAMMRSALNGHPQISLAGETHFFDDLRARKDLAGPGPLSPEQRDLAADYFRALDDRPYGMQGDAARSPLSRSDLSTLADALGGGIDSYLEAYCRRVAARTGGRIWGEKTPRHVFRLREIFACYPTAKVICMVRDPRAVVASYRDWQNRGGLNPGNDPGFSQAIRQEESRARLSYHVVIATMLWRAAANAGLKALETIGPDRVLLVRYEDVVREPRTTLSAISRWLGLEFEESMMDVPLHNSSFETYAKGAGISEVAVARWRTTLTAREIGIIQQVAGRALDRSGYERSEVGSAGLGLLIELFRLPYAVARATFVNRKRMGNVAGFVWRRFRALVAR